LLKPVPNAGHPVIVVRADKQRQELVRPSMSNMGHDRKSMIDETRETSGSRQIVSFASIVRQQKGRGFLRGLLFSTVKAT